MSYGGEVIIRRWWETDSAEDLTLLLHRGYKQLADMGMRFFASHQTVADTLDRISRGRCLVAEVDGVVVGTITWYHGPRHDPYPPLYSQPGVAYFGQFAVEPSMQKAGIGRRLLDQVESEASIAGCSQLALDTSERATHLIEWYLRLGFRHAGFAQWKDTNYRSVLMSRELAGLKPTQ